MRLQALLLLTLLAAAVYPSRAKPKLTPEARYLKTEAALKTKGYGSFAQVLRSSGVANDIIKRYAKGKPVALFAAPNWAWNQWKWCALDRDKSKAVRVHVSLKKDALRYLVNKKDRKAKTFLSGTNLMRDNRTTNAVRLTLDNNRQANAVVMIDKVYEDGAVLISAINVLLRPPGC